MHWSKSRAFDWWPQIDEHVWNRYEATPVDLLSDPYQTPHMVVKIGPTTFTSVVMFLEKSAGTSQARV